MINRQICPLCFRQFPGLEDYSRSLKEIADIKIQRELVILEDQEGGVNCKFGVIYALNFQTSDTQMLSNGRFFAFRTH